MLTECIECGLRVSDLAASCPHCGYPMRNGRTARTASIKRRMKLPNGFGQISEIKGRNLRNPFRAMVTVGRREDGRPVCKPLKPRAYFPTYNDAYKALSEYNSAPYDLESDLTVKQLYEVWFDEYRRSVSSKTSITQTRAAWQYCTEIYDLRVKALRPRHIKKCMDEGKALFRGSMRTAPAPVKSRIKTMFNLMLDYAVEYEIVDMNRSRSFKLSDDLKRELATVKNGHITYTDDEMRALWECTQETCVCMILVQCYSGWRPQELLTLRVADVDIDNLTFRGGMKTESGRNRTVPIHSRISGIVKKYYERAAERGCVYLFGRENDVAMPLSYMQFLRAYSAVRENIGVSELHRLHDGRTHFVTAAKRYGVDEYAIKYIVGHKISDITESVYTKRGPDWLREQIEKIR